jgi:hypothetical protein
VTKRATSRRRPKVKKKQGFTEKKQRVARGKKVTAKLVQGTLAPIPSILNIAKLLDKDYTYEDAHQGLPALSIRDVPKTKKAIAGIYAPDEFNDDARFVFPERFVAKVQSAILAFRETLLTEDESAEDSVGGRVPRFGHFHHKDIIAMNRWHTCMGYLAETEDAISWANNTSIKRVGIPDELSDGVSSEPSERENAIKQLLLRGGRSTPFGEIPYRSLLTFRENVWMDDNAMCHGLALLEREHSNIGVINPIFMRFKEHEVKLRAATVGNPFRNTSDMVLLPLHIDDNHWFGVVFDFRRDSRGITILDPLQAPKSKYYDACETQLKAVFGEMCQLLTIKRETHLRQPDMASCGATVLMFFECFIKGITIADKPSQALIRFMRLRYMLKCLQ